MSYDSAEDTIAHINRVQELLKGVESRLAIRGSIHDYSKLHEPEKSKFDELTPRLKELTYNSPEYKESLRELGTALSHHYKMNRHHPEHFCLGTELDENGDLQYFVHEEMLATGHGIYSMNLIDIIEMLMDWKAASERHENGDIRKSIEVNAKRFGYSDELKTLMLNTADEMGW